MCAAKLKEGERRRLRYVGSTRHRWQERAGCTTLGGWLEPRPNPVSLAASYPRGVGERGATSVEEEEEEEEESPCRVAARDCFEIKYATL